MGAFLEDYGKVVVVIIVVAALITLSIVYKQSGLNTTNESYSGFEGATLNSVDSAVQKVNQSNAEHSR